MGVSAADIGYMRRALALARKGLGTVAPNPAVGAVVVKNRQIIGRGYHRKAGEDHAEVIALKQAGVDSRGADLYVTLEPCNHFGKTPPCTEAIKLAGIKRVIISVRDPNPHVKGNGVEELQAAGIEVTSGVLQEQGEEILRPFISCITEKRPYVTLKLALTLDGAVTSGDPERPWLSSDPAKAYVQRLRSRADGILVGITTILIDNPRLTNRLGRGASPKRIYVDSKMSAHGELNIFNSASETICLTTVDAVIPAFPAKIVKCRATREGQVDLVDALTKLSECGISNLLCEGGAVLASSLLNEGLVDKLILIQCPIISEGSQDKLNLQGPIKLQLAKSVRCGLDLVTVYKR